MHGSGYCTKIKPLRHSTDHRSHRNWPNRTAQARAAHPLHGRRRRGLRESAVIALAVAGLVLLVALATYSPATPASRSRAPARRQQPSVHNRIGPIGAWLADVLFFLFGRPAFLFPVMIGLVAWALFRSGRRPSPPRAPTPRCARAASCCCWPPAAVWRRCTGRIRACCAHRRRRHRRSDRQWAQVGPGFLGATLLMLAAWMAGPSLSFGVSWLTVMDRLGGWSWGARSAGCASGARARSESRQGKERRAARARIQRGDRAEEGRGAQAAHASSRRPPAVEQERAGREGAAGAAVRPRPRPGSCRR